VEVRAEIKKIVWPTREVLIQSTVTVVVITLVLTVYMGVMDLVLRKLYDAFEKLG
jgi:preprotein translocase subunit SecE